MKLINVKLAVASVVALSASNVMAGMIPIDVFSEGDNLAFLQEETGIEWMKFGVTKSQSINTVLEKTKSGGIYEGWRVATRNEVSSLMDYIFPRYNASTVGGRLSWSRNYTGGSYWTYTDRYTPFTSLFGWTRHWESGYSNRDDNYTAYGLYANDFSDSQFTSEFLMSGVSYKRDQKGSNPRNHTYTASIYEDWGDNAYSGNYVNPNYSVFLVSDGGYSLDSLNNPELNANNPNSPVNAVPEPSGVALLGVSILGLTLFRKRRKEA
tara:strand:- start:2210 stop:3007 length:798 start_codon:yes stop_codon:yes gene_type:complete